MIYSSSSPPPLRNDFFNLTRSVEGDTVVIIGVSFIWINDDEELSFNVSVDKRLKIRIWNERKIWKAFLTMYEEE